MLSWNDWGVRMRAMVRAAPIAVWLILSPSIADAEKQGHAEGQRLRSSFAEFRQKAESATNEIMTYAICNPYVCTGSLAQNQVQVIWRPGGFKSAEITSTFASGLTAFPAACVALFAHIGRFDVQIAEAVFAQLVEHAQQGGTARGSIGDVDFRFGFDRANLPKCEATLRERL